ncbi:MerC domain-containing protein [Kordiimonas sp. SCSIO 12603]|uniref:MerC domain-containing protein n=1 Tax=Kordiimonas sp. SCSIO 12603 TaxID=2829596 RepID=UPI002105B671|nr:MerC domain-containing protein [Kordiimonas sp. SCSIO 12603]UTW59920.1 MerC domain-containing protein [Kordiimonas sp. SCSIO 12603]
MEKPAAYSSVMDRIAMAASGLCVVHCILTPILIAVLPAIAVYAEINHDIELLLIGVMLPLSAFALFRGYKCHCSMQPTVNAAGGVALLLLAQLVLESETGELIASVAGGLALITAHIINIKAGRHCASGSACES